VALVADAHLSGPGGPAGPLVEQLRGLPDAGCGRLVLLGDLFQLWIGDRRYETPDIARVVETLVALRRAGVRVEYIEGNRDFFLADGPYAEAFDLVATELAFEVDGTRYLAVHGDGLDRRDWKYRFWRAISKSAAGRFIGCNIPRRIAGRVVRGTEEKLSATNQEHKRRIPEEVLRGYGERRLAEGHDVLLLGHFHVERTLAVDGGEVRLIDAWYNSGRIEWL
jgi:UDP-2,3-diacylglucosamine hydrolase